MSEKIPVLKKKVGKKPKKKSETSSPRTPKSRKSSNSSSPKPTDSESVPRMILPIRVCQIHKKAFTFYCDNQEELLCEECAISPLYSKFPAKVLKIEDALRMRLAGLYNTLNNYIMPKRLQLESQKSRLLDCLAAVKAKKCEIERDMKGEFSAMNERLNFSYGTKQAILQNDLAGLEVDYERIQHAFNLVDSSSNDHISFLQRQTDIKALIDLSLSKPFRMKIDVRSDDLPVELNKVREITHEYSATEQLVTLKNELI